MHKGVLSKPCRYNAFVRHFTDNREKNGSNYLKLDFGLVGSRLLQKQLRSRTKAGDNTEQMRFRFFGASRIYEGAVLGSFLQFTRISSWL